METMWNAQSCSTRSGELLVCLYILQYFNHVAPVKSGPWMDGEAFT